MTDTRLPTPRATYRMQLTADRGFDHAVGLVDYLAALGISHLYLSPFLAARPTTTHFYDVTDHSRIDQRLGGEEGLRRLADRAHDAGLGLIADVVTHHMAAGPWSPMWRRMLREGRSSNAASMFEIDWEPPLPGAAEKVILPVLGQPYGDALSQGLLGLQQHGEEVVVTYGDLRLPLTADTEAALARSGGVERLAGRIGEPRTWGRMHSLLEQQHYRLVSYAAGRRLVNYRRYLAVDQLAAIHADSPDVFAHTHALIIALLDEGLLDGLRIAHVDGLADPAGYLRGLREAVGPDVWIVVERAGAAGDPVPEDWPVQGTTGYELLRTSLGLHVDPQGLGTLWSHAAEHDALPSSRDVWIARSEQLEQELAPDLRRLARATWEACQEQPAVRDVDYRTLLEAVTRLLVAMPVPRTYVDPRTGEATERDRRAIGQAVDAAAQVGDRGTIPAALWSYLQELFSGATRPTTAAAEAITRFQQLAIAAMTLGIEERVFFRHNAFVAACELGCDPRRVPITLEEAHRQIAEMPPLGMRTTATHDTKHGEDVRLRIAGLTGVAGEWTRLASRVLAGTAPPDAALGLRLLQIAVGIWPVTDDGSAPLSEVLSDASLGDRLVAYAIAAARGQQRLTSHLHPDGEVEQEIAAWTRGLVDPAGLVAAELRGVANAAAEIGICASLSQTLMRITVPGVPDTYQGTEGWDDSLSDPDNRRPVDMEALAAELGRLTGPDAPEVDELWEARRDGRIKLHVLATALRLRREMPQTFGPDGSYEPVTATGRWARHMVAYLRRGSDGDVLVVCPRVMGRVSDGGVLDPRGRIWADTDLHLPVETTWTDALSGHHVAGDVLAVADVLSALPVALLRTTT